MLWYWGACCVAGLPSSGVCNVCSIKFCVTRGQSQQALVNTTSYMMMAHTSVEAVAPPCTSKLRLEVLSGSCLCQSTGYLVITIAPSPKCSLLSCICIQHCNYWDTLTADQSTSLILDVAGLHTGTTLKGQLIAMSTTHMVWGVLRSPAQTVAVT